MKNKIQTIKRNDLLSLGFVFLFPGIFLASIMDINRTLQVIGVVLLLISSALFGASIRAESKHKK